MRFSLRHLVPVLAAVSLLLGASEAKAHALFASPVPRTTSDRELKRAPCGGRPRTATPHKYTAGQTIELEWRETVAHPGHYIVSFSKAGDANWVVMKDRIPNPDGRTPSQKTTVTLPTEPCTDCTIQLIQVMTETNPPSNYYSCIDINIAAAVPSEPTPTNPTPTEPTPTDPTPTNPTPTEPTPTEPTPTPTNPQPGEPGSELPSQEAVEEDEVAKAQNTGLTDVDDFDGEVVAGGCTAGMVPSMMAVGALVTAALVYRRRRP